MSGKSGVAQKGSARVACALAAILVLVFAGCACVASLAYAAGGDGAPQAVADGADGAGGPGNAAGGAGGDGGAGDSNGGAEADAGAGGDGGVAGALGGGAASVRALGASGESATAGGADANGISLLAENTYEVTSAAQYRTAIANIGKLPEGSDATIVFTATTSFTSPRIEGVAGRNLTITANEGVTATVRLAENLKGNLKLDRVRLDNANNGDEVYANGFRFETTENTMSAKTYTNTANTLFGGSKTEAVASTELVLNGGVFRYVYAGGKDREVTGDTHLTIGGTVQMGSAYGGGKIDRPSTSDESDAARAAAAVAGTANVTVEGWTGSGRVYGGSYNSIVGDVRMTVADTPKGTYYGTGVRDTVRRTVELTYTCSEASSASVNGAGASESGVGPCRILNEDGAGEALAVHYTAPAADDILSFSGEACAITSNCPVEVQGNVTLYCHGGSPENLWLSDAMANATRNVAGDSVLVVAGETHTYYLAGLLNEYASEDTTYTTRLEVQDGVELTSSFLQSLDAANIGAGARVQTTGYSPFPPTSFGNDPFQKVRDVTVGEGATLDTNAVFCSLQGSATLKNGSTWLLRGALEIKGDFAVEGAASLKIPVVADGRNYGTGSNRIPLRVDGTASGACNVHIMESDYAAEARDDIKAGQNYIVAAKQAADSPAESVFTWANASIPDGLALKRVDDAKSANNFMWQIAQDAYTVRFDKNADAATGAMPDQTIASGAAEALAANQFVREGWTFTGWNTQPDGSGTAYANQASVRDLVAAGGSVTLYAQWKENEQLWYYEVYYQYEDEFVCWETGQGGRAALSATVRISNETFDNTDRGDLGWPDVTGERNEMLGVHYVFDADNPNNRLSATCAEATKDNPLKIYYKCAPHTVTYQYEGDVLPEGAAALLPGPDDTWYSAEYQVKDAPECAGYAFSGWRVVSPESVEIDDGVLVVPNGDVVLAGSWTALADELSYQANAAAATGSMDPTPGLTGVEAVVAENAFVRPGYEFAGWNTAADGSGDAYAAGSKLMLTEGDDVLYAQWRALGDAVRPSAVNLVAYEGGLGTGSTGGADEETGNALPEPVWRGVSENWEFYVDGAAWDATAQGMPFAWGYFEKGGPDAAEVDAAATHGVYELRAWPAAEGHEVVARDADGSWHVLDLPQEGVVVAEVTVRDVTDDGGAEALSTALFKPVYSDAALAAASGQGVVKRFAAMAARTVVLAAGDAGSALDATFTVSGTVHGDCDMSEPHAHVSESTGFLKNGNAGMPVNANARIGLLDDGLIDGVLGGAREDALDAKARAAVGGEFAAGEGVGHTFRYLDLVDMNDGNVWASTDDGSDTMVFLPYTADMTADADVAVVLFSNLTRDYTVHASEAELDGALAASTACPLAVTKTAEGIQFSIPSAGFGPIEIMWKAAGAPGDTPGGSTGSTDGPGAGGVSGGSVPTTTPATGDGALSLVLGAGALAVAGGAAALLARRRARR